MLALYTFTIFVGALLLFGVQPLFARLILPLLGGSPAVWNTAMVFFQAVLLAGYAYAHLTSTHISKKRQTLGHIVVLLLPLALLPLAIPANWSPPTSGNPIPWLLGLMAVTVGLPFFVLSTTSPLLQKWFAGSRHPRAGDPYFLYVASNVGSLLALLTYPVLIEPRLTLAAQGRWWAAGYVGFVGLVIACAWALRAQGRAVDALTLKPMPSPAEPSEQAARLNTPPPTPAARLRWVALSFVPSSLLLGVTTFISTEIAVVPLLWVLPLALYLLTFVLAFARRPWASTATLARALPVVLVPVVMVLAVQANQPILPIALLHLVAFFLCSWLCHSRLAESRPPARYLTEFYLWMSVGGVLGGIFNALIAPTVFDHVFEYAIALVLVCLVALSTGGGSTPRARRLDWLAPLGVAVLGAGLVGLSSALGWSAGSAAFRLSVGALALGCFFFSRRPLRFALGLSVLLLTGAAVRQQANETLVTHRSFFGVHRVQLDETGRYHLLFHGHIAHGKQALATDGRREALAYYHRTGPVGELVSHYANDPADAVGVVGLGTGTMAAYALPGQRWTFYEIDPVVLSLASDPRYFTFLADSPGELQHVLGDARLSLLGARDAAYNFLVLDAYSSDAIPVHLLTREALALYLSKLAPEGVIAFHISNLHLDLEPVLAHLAADAGLVCLVRDDTGPVDPNSAPGKSPSVWLVMARERAHVNALTRDPRWFPARRIEGQALWTDDYSSLLSVLRWR